MIQRFFLTIETQDIYFVEGPQRSYFCYALTTYFVENQRQLRLTLSRWAAAWQRRNLRP